MTIGMDLHLLREAQQSASRSRSRSRAVARKLPCAGRGRGESGEAVNPRARQRGVAVGCQANDSNAVAARHAAEVRWLCSHARKRRVQDGFHPALCVVAAEVNVVLPHGLFEVM